LNAELDKQESAFDALSLAVSKAQEASEKAPNNAELTEGLANLQAACRKQLADVSMTRKSLDDKTHKLTSDQNKLAASKKHLESLAAETAAARQQAEKLTKSSKTAGDKAAADKQMVDRAGQAVTDTQKEIDHWSDEINFAKVGSGQ